MLRPGEGEVLSGGSGRAELKAVRETTGGAFSMSETTVAPGFPGPPPHVHRAMYDAFYVLDGTLTLLVGDETVEAQAGTFACAPPGTVHTFANPSDAPVRFLNINSPAGWEGYLRELAQAMPSEGPPDPAVVGPIAAKYDFEPASE